jgi:polyferredoxin
LIGFGAKEHFGAFLSFFELFGAFGAPTCGAVFPFGFCESLFLRGKVPFCQAGNCQGQ